MNLYLLKDSEIAISEITANGQGYGHAGATPGEVIRQFSEKQYADLSGDGWDLYHSRLATADSTKGEYVSSISSGIDRGFRPNSPQYPNRMITDGTEIDIELDKNITIDSIVIYFGTDYLSDFSVVLTSVTGTVRENISVNNNSDSVVAITPTYTGLSRKIRLIAGRSHLPRQYFYLKGISINGNILPIERIKDLTCTHDLDLLCENLPIDDFSATFVSDSELDTTAYSRVSSVLGTYYIDTINTSDKKVYSLVAYSELSRLADSSESYAFPPGVIGDHGGGEYISFNTVINTAVSRSVIPGSASIYVDQRMQLISSGITNRELVQRVCQACALRVTTPDGYIHVSGGTFPEGTDIVSSDIIGRVELRKVQPQTIICRNNLYSSEGANEEDIHIYTSPGGSVRIQLPHPYYNCTIRTTGLTTDYQIDTPFGSRDFVIRDVRTAGATNQTLLSMVYLSLPQELERTYTTSPGNGAEVKSLDNGDYYFPIHTPGIDDTISRFYQRVCAINQEITARILLRDRQVGQRITIPTAAGDLLPILITHLDILGDGGALIADMKGVIWDV